MKTFSKPILMTLRTKTSETITFYQFIKARFDTFISNSWSGIDVPQLNQYIVGKKVSNILSEQFPYISNDLQAQINNVSFQKFVLAYKTDNVPIQLELYTKSFTQNDFEKLLLVINFCIYYCQSIKKQTCQSLTIKLILSPYKKLIKKKPQQLGKGNVNGGVTIKNYTQETCKIIIFRKEELMKVLIHEILHSFDLDSKTISKTDEHPLNDFFNINKEQSDEFDTINVNESFTDTYACLLNLCISAILLAKRCKVNGEKIFNALLKLETNHIINQSRKVAKVASIPMYNDILTENKAVYTERTHVISYYVLKGINFANIEDFVRLLVENQYTLHDYNKYISYLFSKLDNSRLGAIYNKKVSIENNKKINNFYLKCLERTKLSSSLRMSCVDILDI
jgi:hypothetical protein